MDTGICITIGADLPSHAMDGLVAEITALYPVMNPDLTPYVARLLWPLANELMEMQESRKASSAGSLGAAAPDRKTR